MRAGWPSFLACFAVCVAHAAEGADLSLVHGGPVALDVNTPAATDGSLSSGASLNLKTAEVSMNLKASASVGGDPAATNLWGKRHAEVDASWPGPHKTTFNLSGSDESTLSYRDPASLGDPGTATHVIRAENRSAKLATTFSPAAGTQLEIGAEGSNSTSEDTSALRPSSENRTTIASKAQAIYATLNWTPRDWIAVQAAAAAHTEDVTWRDRQAMDSAYTSVDPRLSVTVKPWAGTTLSASVEHTVSPYDTAAFSAYAGAAQAPGTVRFEPDHAWRIHSEMGQTVGPLNLSAAVTAESAGTVTEFGLTPGGTQGPVSTALDRREQVALAVSAPLDGIGLKNTSVSSATSWNDSMVRDPVTADLRRASGETPHKVTVSLTHNMPSNRLSFGLTGELADANTNYQTNEVSTAAGGGTLGAFLAYKPGRYEVDLNVSGIGGSATTDTFYNGGRADSNVARSVVQPAQGPTVSFSLHKAL